MASDTGPSGNTAEQSSSARWKRLWSLHTPDSLRTRAQQLGRTKYIVEGLVPAASVGMVLGDSGLGKSPLMYQLAICVAAGLPFLGRQTRKSCVLIADFENGMADILELVEGLSRFLGLPEHPNSDDLLLWTAQDCSPQYGQADHTLLDMLRDVKPALAIIDSLASYDPDAEEKNRTAGKLLRQLRGIARDVGTATYFVHHRRKQPRKADEGAGPLESANIRRWFEDARGASALVNGSDVRLGVGEPDISAVQKDGVALVVRGFGRVRGEIGPLYVARDLDENSDPTGYRLLVGPELLFNREHEQAFERLPRQFSFKEAKQIYGKSDQPTHNWLQRLLSLGLILKQGRGAYEKISQSAGSG